MRKIYITIGIDIEKDFFRTLKVTARYSIGDLIDMYPDRITYPFGFKPDVVLFFLDNSMGDVLIENAIDTESEYIRLSGELATRNCTIGGAFISIEKADNADFRSFYEQHSRWLDYTPEAIEQISEEYHRELLQLIKRMKEDGIRITFLVTS